MINGQPVRVSLPNDFALELWRQPQSLPEIFY
jgi:hypothetical protein